MESPKNEIVQPMKRQEMNSSNNELIHNKHVITPYKYTCRQESPHSVNNNLDINIQLE
jgi:hypothetical protein